MFTEEQLDRLRSFPDIDKDELSWSSAVT